MSQVAKSAMTVKGKWKCCLLGTDNASCSSCPDVSSASQLWQRSSRLTSFVPALCDFLFRMSTTFSFSYFFLFFLLFFFFSFWLSLYSRWLSVLSFFLSCTPFVHNIYKVSIGCGQSAITTTRYITTRSTADIVLLECIFVVNFVWRLFEFSLGGIEGRHE